MTMTSLAAPPSTIDTHLELLVWLQWLWAGFNATVGVAMAAFAVAAFLAGATGASVPGAEMAAEVTAGAFFAVSLTALAWSAVHAWCAKALRRREPWGRLGALALALFDALLVPLGTLLAAYTAWLLLQDAGRRRFEQM